MARVQETDKNIPDRFKPPALNRLIQRQCKLKALGYAKFEERR